MSEKNSVPKTVLGTKLALGVKERVMLTQLRPLESNSETQFIAEDVEQKTALTDAEKKKCGMVETKNPQTGAVLGVNWDGNKEFETEFVFSDAEVKYLIDQKNRLEKEQKVTPQLTSLFRRLINLKMPEKK